MATIDGKVTFEAGGRNHSLQFLTNRLVLAEDKLDKTSLDIATELQFNPRMSTLRTLFWAGIGQGDITLAAAGDLMDELGKKRAVALVREAFAAAFPKDEDEPKKEGGANPPDAVAG